MSIEGSQLQFMLSQKQAKWRGQDDGKALDFNKAPNDYLRFQGVALEPQRIRTFLISYNLPENTIKEKDLLMHKARVLAGLEQDPRGSGPAEEHGHCKSDQHCGHNNDGK